VSDIARAAELRSSQYRTRGDRPQQRCATFDGRGRGYTSPSGGIRAMGDPQPYSGMVPSGGYWTGDAEGPFAAGDVYWTGLASSTDSPYEMYDSCGPYEEVVAPGAFMRSLALGSQLDVPLVIQHDDARRLARTTIPWGTPGALQLNEGNAGLEFRAQMDPADPDVQYATRKINAGLMTECSFRFEITSGEWSPDYSSFVIHSVNLQRGDVSLCGFGANPRTAAAVGRAAAPADEKAARRLYEQLQSRFATNTNALVTPPAPRTYLVRDDDLR